MISGLLLSLVIGGLIWRNLETRLIQNPGWDIGLTFILFGFFLSYSGRLIPWGALSAMVGFLSCIMGLYSAFDWRQWHK